MCCNLQMHATASVHRKKCMLGCQIAGPDCWQIVAVTVQVQTWLQQCSSTSACLMTQVAERVHDLKSCRSAKLTLKPHETFPDKLMVCCNPRQPHINGKLQTARHAESCRFSRSPTTAGEQRPCLQKSYRPTMSQGQR